MKRPQAIIFLLMINSIQAFSQSNCPETTTVSLYNDTTKCALRLMGEVLTIHKNSCDTYVMKFDHIKSKINDVYELGFYHQSENESTVQVSFFTDSKWTEGVQYKVSGKGYKKHPISIIDQGSKINAVTVEKVKITILSKNETSIDEIEFRYTKPEKLIHKGITKKQKAVIITQFNKKNRREEKALKRAQQKQQKQQYGQEQ